MKPAGRPYAVMVPISPRMCLPPGGSAVLTALKPHGDARLPKPSAAAYAPTQIPTASSPGIFVVSTTPSAMAQKPNNATLADRLVRRAATRMSVGRSIEYETLMLPEYVFRGAAVTTLTAAEARARLRARAAVAVGAHCIPIPAIAQSGARQPLTALCLRIVTVATIRAPAFETATLAVAGTHGALRGTKWIIAGTRVTEVCAVIDIAARAGRGKDVANTGQVAD